MYMPRQVNTLMTLNLVIHFLQRRDIKLCNHHVLEFKKQLMETRMIFLCSREIKGRVSLCFSYTYIASVKV